ncbi:peptide/nickel transport system ATP-binding protein [Ketogulonicigenium robustum]|uniref:Peptide/nickel transport system ATP-binding protein n=1 Tax=Ketogulonicigenium robustum TaxID=92947 RepID=A0A1W6NWC6_9RHOB|nr:ABC transporter ATP-binding protein [Ketogulonicigenium robustum]ARO13511.1 peptide/nickel transport system ATP-binding protein [Ketogulonicigenium robustum]
MTTLSDQPVLALQNVSKTFGSKENPIYAARDINFGLYPGRTLALVGESGSGKTTVARLLMREYIPDAGQLTFRGAPVQGASKASLRAYRSAVQMVFQDPFSSLNPTRTIHHHLSRPLHLHRPDLDRKGREAAIIDLLARVQLDPARVLHKFPHELSGGMRQRISIARALAVNPQVIVADEPTSMLDVSVRLGILNLLNDMKSELGLALLYITHDIATARFVAEDIMVMYAGQVVEWGDMDSVLTNPQHPYTRLLLAAVPDPDRRIDAAAPQNELARVEDIRAASARVQTEVQQIAPNHFIRKINL